MTRGPYIKHVVGSEPEDQAYGCSEPEDDNSNDSWTTLEEFSSDYIYRYGCRYFEPERVFNFLFCSCSCFSFFEVANQGDACLFIILSFFLLKLQDFCGNGLLRRLNFLFFRNSSHSLGSNNNKNDKPFACPVPGCKKRYKNVNGIKYHSKNGHKNDGKYVCHVSLEF